MELKDRQMRLKVTEGGAPASLVARVEKALGRVVERMKADDRAKVESCLGRAADAAGVDAVLVAVVERTAPVPHPAVLELARQAVEGADDAALDALVARELAARAAGKGERPRSFNDVANGLAATLAARRTGRGKTTSGSVGAAVAGLL
jgi:hypothetical protein